MVMKNYFKYKKYWIKVCMLKVSMLKCNGCFLMVLVNKID